MVKPDDVAMMAKEALDSAKSAHKRIDEMKEVVNSIHELAGNMRAMTETMGSQGKAIDKINANLELINLKPSKWVDLVKSTLISAFFGGIGAAIVALLLK
jgi:t-SNARE complex subunit (syntaxin)